MADEDDNKEKDSKESGKSSSSMMLIIAIVGLLVVGGGGAAFFMMGAEKEESEEEIVKKALFHNLEPFVISLTGDRKPHYLQLELAIMTREEPMVMVLEENTPLIRNELIGFLNGMTYKDALLADTPDRLRKGSLEKVREALSELGGEQVEDVMIVNMVIQ
ncbi:flagellar basal body-associated FliL family protein [Parendozoicomonas haliclonae]|uniref:Flagellar protein FliL n=1 Tax=Parendozoicomonas haliclonae TaxID=1960125 RepID=A0A1X7AGT1_9GAMM|nr:flagellar basal body-associated FliL family protein [Parendozoicomonas haliclonae]SMA39836.1 flagellar basal body-associated protein FliL [Parendozoicomonas haliclonae]